MKRVTVFEKYAQEYDAWFDANPSTYRAEVGALSPFIPKTGNIIEVGVGTGRFALPLGIKIGIDPALSMAQFARRKGIHVCQAWGEALPFRSDCFDSVLLVTVVCFIENVSELFCEVFRILKPGGSVVLGIIDKQSVRGRLYESYKITNKFYREANFYSVSQIKDWIQETGFSNPIFRQTVFEEEQAKPKTESIQDGYGHGAFVALKADKPDEGVL